MKDIKEKFDIITESYPKLSSAMCFVKMVKRYDKNKIKWTKDKLTRSWKKLVDKDDYAGRELREIISWLIKSIIK